MGRTFVFAGGGTGGHIYPGIAVAQRIQQLAPEAKIIFFCSNRDIDKSLLERAGFDYMMVPAVGLSLHPKQFIEFVKQYFRSRKIAVQRLSQMDTLSVIGIGGFVAGPVCHAAHKLGVPISLINVDIVPGKANKLARNWAQQVFLQFEETAEYFARAGALARVTGCPLRQEFESPDGKRAIEQLGLLRDKKILLVLGGSSGAKSVNEAVCSLINKMERFADSWQVVHLTGRANYEDVAKSYAGSKICHKVLPYYDAMADLMAASELAIGRAGAVSIAEYTAAVLPTLLMPYPHHKDQHQYRNANKLVEAGAAVIVDDLPELTERAEWLLEEIEQLLEDESQRDEMRQSCQKIGSTAAASRIAKVLLDS